MHLEEKAAGWMKETQKGYIRIAVLILLNKKSHHGYEMMKSLDERTSGFWKPTAGGIYPILQDLENSGYITGEWDQETKRKRKIYQITNSGKKVLERTLEKESQLANIIANLFKEYMKDVLDVEVTQTQLPKTSFALFLEEGKCKPEDSISVLEYKRSHLQEIIKNMQEQLLQINKQLAQMEKKEEPGKTKKQKHKEKK